MNRRNFIVKSIQFGAAAIFGIFSLPGCGKNEKKNNVQEAKTADPCADLSGISEEEIKLRESYQYISSSTYPDKNCKNCELWIEPEDGKLCGGCDLFEGPVNPKGYCNTWIQVEV